MPIGHFFMWIIINKSYNFRSRYTEGTSGLINNLHTLLAPTPQTGDSKCLTTYHKDPLHIPHQFATCWCQCMLDLIFYLLHLYVGRLWEHTRPVIGNWCVNFLKNSGMSWPQIPTITLTHPPFHPHLTPLIFNFRVLLWSIIFLPPKFH